MFLKWYEEQTTFDFQADLLKYCISDVDILRRCCGKFRSLFMEHTGICPFNNCCTIASACNKVYRTLFLQEEQIGIVPPQGYGPKDKQSIVALCWLDWLAETQDLQIQHAMNGGEVSVEGRKVDGMDQHGTIYEFHGKNIAKIKPDCYYSEYQQIHCFMFC